MEGRNEERNREGGKERRRKRKASEVDLFLKTDAKNSSHWWTRMPLAHWQHGISFPSTRIQARLGTCFDQEKVAEVRFWGFWNPALKDPVAVGSQLPTVRKLRKTAETTWSQHEPSPASSAQMAESWASTWLLVLLLFVRFVVVGNVAIKKWNSQYASWTET